MAQEEEVPLPPPAWSQVLLLPTPCHLTAQCTTSRLTSSVWIGIRVTWSTCEMPSGALNAAPGPAATGRLPTMEKILPQTQPLRLPHRPPPTLPWQCFRSTSHSSREEATALLQASRGQPLWLQHDPSGAAQSGTAGSGTSPSAKIAASASLHVPKNAACRGRSSSQSLCLIAPPPRLRPPLY